MMKFIISKCTDIRNAVNGGYEMTGLDCDRYTQHGVGQLAARAVFRVREELKRIQQKKAIIRFHCCIRKDNSKA